MIRLTGGTLVGENGCEENRGILIEERKFTDVEAGDCETYDITGLYAAPGFIDIHTHGGIGFDFARNTCEGILEAAAFNARNGVTAVMPTYEGSQTPSDEEYRIYGAVSDAMKAEDGPEILGMHFEGPFCSPKYAPGDPVIPDRAAYMQMLGRAGSLRRWTIAPETENAEEVIREATGRGICVSLGHSDATLASVDMAIACGAKLVTHFYSGMNGFYRKDMVRHPGLIEATWLRPLYVEMICDGVHLDPDMMSLVYKLKGADHICCVTDSHYREIGKNETFETVPRVRVLQRKSGPSLDSAMPYPEMLRILRDEVGLPLNDVIKMATLTPAKVLGIDGRKGRIAPGYDADVTVFDENLRICLVIARGKVVWSVL